MRRPRYNAFSTIWHSTPIAQVDDAMRHLLQDIRFGVRVLKSNPGFAAVAVFSLGLGIACTTTVFSWIDSVMLHPYPGVRDSHRLASLEMITDNAPNGGTSISWPDYRDYRDQMKTISGLAVRRQCAFTIGEGHAAQLVWGELVSGNYFEVMEVQAKLGRTFNREEATDGIGAAPVVAISDRLWRRYFHADPAIAGKTVRINRHPMTVVGVIPAEFRGGWPVMQFDLWVPVTMAPALGLPADTFTDRGDSGMLSTICRLKPGVTVEQASTEAAALAARLAALYPKTNQGVRATILPSGRQHNGVNELLRTPLAILLAVSFVVLLIVCANVANLLLTRAVTRQREFGIRCALGATKTNVATQVLMETLVLALLGAGVGVLMLQWMQGSLLALAPSVGFPLGTETGLNGRVLAFTALACIAAAIVAGVSPAMFVFHSNLNDVLKEGSRTETASLASRRTRSLFVMAEVALAMVAVVGAGLFGRSFRNLRAIPTGFRADHVLFGRFFVESAGYNSDEMRQFAARLKQRLLLNGDVESVSYTDFVPLSETAGPYNDIQVEGYTPARGENPAVNRALVAPDYFTTMRIPILEGRDFNLNDNRTGEPVMIVNQAFAQRYFHGQNAVGRRVRAAGKWRRVVGLAHDSKYFSPAEPPAPHLYRPFAQSDGILSELFLLARTKGAPEDQIPRLRIAVLETDPNMAAFHAMPLSSYIEVATFGQKVAASLMGALGLVCLLLAALGLYSVMSYSISQRIPEIAIRVAMGATAWNVIAMILRQGMALTLTGILVGTAVAIAATRLIATALFGVDAADPWTFAGAGIFLVLVAVTATWFPAFRATRVDALAALRR